MIRVLKCYVTTTLTYTAQVDESVLYFWIETQQGIEYVCCTCFVSTSNDSRIFFKCFVTQTLTYIAQVRGRCDTYLYWNSPDYWVYVLKFLCKAANDYRLKCFVTPILANTAQVNESVLHDCFDTHQIFEYMCWPCIVRTANDSRIKMLSYADLNLYRL